MVLFVFVSILIATIFTTGIFYAGLDIDVKISQTTFFSRYFFLILLLSAFISQREFTILLIWAGIHQNYEPLTI